MIKKLFALTALPAAALFAAVAAVPAQANYICTGISASAAGNPFFDTDLTDANCDVTEVEAALGITIDTSLIAGSKTNADDDPITSWTQDEFGLGTLTVTDFNDFSGTWTLTDGDIEPLFFVVKYDGGYDAYTYMGTGTPFSDSWDDSNRGGPDGALCGTGKDFINCKASVSHVSVYGVVPVPAAVWLFGSGLLGLVGIARKRRS